MRTPSNSLELYENNHNVFILGAGFSVEAGMPVVKNFFKMMRHALTRAVAREDSDAAEALGQVLTWRLRSGAAAYRCKIDPDNIEELFSLIDGSKGRNGLATHNKEAMRKAIIETLIYCDSIYRDENNLVNVSIANGYNFELFHPYLKSFTPSDLDGIIRIPKYDAIALVLSGKLYATDTDRIRPRNTIITFNYDTVLESSFERTESPFDLRLDPVPNLGVVSDYKYYCKNDDNSPQLLKLHGSINWKLSNIDKGPKMYQLSALQSAENLWKDKYSSFPYVLEPPTWNKGRSAEILQSLWDEAVSQIRTATRIFIIGYSFPKSDMHFKYLMASGLAENISLEKIYIVNPALDKDDEQEGILERLYQIFREDIKTDGILQLLPYSATNFILALQGNVHMNHDSLLFYLYPDLELSVFS